MKTFLILLGVVAASISGVFSSNIYDNNDDDGHGDNSTLVRSSRQIFSGYCTDEIDDKRAIVLQQAQQVPVTPGPATAAYRGHGGRMEMVEATIRGRHLDTGSAPTDATRMIARTFGGPDDDAGHIIANRLGGTGAEAWNIFPQSKDFNRGTWAQQEDTIYNIVQLGSSVKYTVILEYCNGGTRPTKVWYRYTYKDKDGNHCLANEIENPASTPSRTGRQARRGGGPRCLLKRRGGATARPGGVTPRPGARPGGRTRRPGGRPSGVTRRPGGRPGGVTRRSGGRPGGRTRRPGGRPGGRPAGGRPRARPGARRPSGGSTRSRGGGSTKRGRGRQPGK